MIDNHSHFVFLMAGLGFFMYGIQLSGESLQKLAANRIRNIFNYFVNRKSMAVLGGTALTILMQSSGAVTSMLVQLGTARIVNLPQVMGVILGTAVGSTFTVQLISFNVAQYGLSLFLIAFSFHFLAKKRAVKEFSAAIMGFGLIFYGMELMSYGTVAIKSSLVLQNLILEMRTQPLLAMVIVAGFTGIVHSSAVTIGLAINLSMSGIITNTEAMYWIFGANIGTTSTALMTAAGGNSIGKQVAWAHFIYKVGGVLLFIGFSNQFMILIEGFSGSVPRTLANAHTIYNVLTALIFFPFIEIGASFIEKFYPETESEKDIKLQYLNSDYQNSPAMVIAHAKRESLRICDILKSMLEDSIQLFEGRDPDLAKSIKKRDDQIDYIHQEIKFYLTRNLRGEYNQYMVYLVSFVNDLESAADVIDNSLVSLAQKKEQYKMEFSQKGWNEIKQLHKLLIEIAETSISSFSLQDKKLAKASLKLEKAFRIKESEFKEFHIDRLNEGNKNSINTSAIHMEILGDFRQIAGLLVNHAYRH